MVLIVDDNAAIRDVLYHFCKHLKVEAKTAESTETAKEVLKQFQVDTVPPDHNMPGGNGVDLIPFLYCLQPVPYIILLSGLVPPKDVILMCDEVLLKPVILQTLQRCLARQQKGE